MLFAAVPLVFVLAAVVTYVIESRAWARKKAQQERVLDGARDAVAQAPAGVVAPPCVAPLSGRPALAWHVDVVVRERIRNGNVEEIHVRRIHEEAQGSFDAATTTGERIPFTLEGASVFETPEAIALPNVTVYFSQTSAFVSGGATPPEHIARFLFSRGLPQPTADSMFQPGVAVYVNERVVVPGTALWVAPSAGAFALGTVAAARKKLAVPVGEVLWTSSVVGFLAGAGTGMLCAILSQVLERR